MYVPKFNEEKDISVLHRLIKSKPLGAWTAISGGAIEVNHIPFVLKENDGELGTLVGHVARNNRIWQTLSVNQNSVVIFQGDQAYITPSWYPSKHKDGKAVPTWNYAVVHAYGIPRVFENPEELMAHITELTEIHEADQALPWKVSDAPQEYIDKLLAAIVGIEIPIAKIVGKWKLGQNRPDSDKLGIIAGLKSGSDHQSHSLADQLFKQLGFNKTSDER